MATTLTISDALKYANLQMAAEAFLADSGGVIKPDLNTALIEGNGHASKFTASGAEVFLEQWTVVAQKTNTETGFSGTLFQSKSNLNELVLSFRSTEFIDDAVRDNLATNQMEIKDTGFAWGQVADMEAWYDELTGSGGKLSGGQQVTVTGYSLGAHLANVFNLLHSGTIDKVVTFNGAGVGQIKTGHTLKDQVTQFESLWKSTASIQAYAEALA